MFVRSTRARNRNDRIDLYGANRSHSHCTFNKCKIGRPTRIKPRHLTLYKLESCSSAVGSRCPDLLIASRMRNATSVLITKPTKPIKDKSFNPSGPPPMNNKGGTFAAIKMDEPNKSELVKSPRTIRLMDGLSPRWERWTSSFPSWTSSTSELI